MSHTAEIGIIMCRPSRHHLIVCFRVTNRAEDLFHGNLAPASGGRADPLDATLQGFCLCDGSRQCGRKATSDTTADGAEPQRNVRLAVPKTPMFIRKRRQRRQAPEPEQDSAVNGRTYSAVYK